MRRSTGRDFKRAFAKTLVALLAALLVPQVALAECPPPKTPPIGDQFYFCFDGSRVRPQPIIDADKGRYLVVEVELNGRKLPALLDTGAGISVVDTSVAKDIDLKAGGIL